MGLFSALGTIAGGFFGPLGAKIGGSIGGAIDGKKALKARNAHKGSTTTEQSTRVNFLQLRQDAEKAGFNPLTALRATGGRGGTTTTTTTHPALSSGSYLSEALGAGLNTLFEYDPKKEARDEEVENIKRDIMREELNKLQKQNKAIERGLNFGFNIPTYSGTGATHADISTNSNDGTTNLISDRGVWRDTDDNPDLAVFGNRWKSDTRTSSAEKAETLYGDIGGALYGVGKLGVDLVYNGVEEVRRVNDLFNHQFEKNKKPPLRTQRLKKRKPKQGPRPLHYRRLITPPLTQ